MKGACRDAIINIYVFAQRYGWHGLDDPDLQANMTNAVEKYPWVDEFRDRSVTELEFLHGHLNNPGDLPAIVVFRDKVCLMKNIDISEKIKCI